MENKISNSASSNFWALLKDTTSLVGIGLLAFSLTIFAMTSNNFEVEFELFSGVFFVCFGITIAYTMVVMFSNFTEFGAYFKFKHFGRNILLLQLFNISAYALNRTISVFSLSVDWVIWLLIASNILLTIYAFFKDQTPSLIKHLLAFVAGLALMFHFYESIYLFQGYIITALTFWFFGITLHVFIPLFFFISFLIIVNKLAKEHKKYLIGVSAGLILALSFTIYFGTQYNRINTIVHDQFHENQTPFHKQNLPQWVVISQSLPNHWVSERVLKTSLQFATSNNAFNPFNSGLNAEQIKHDPLLVIASFFGESLDIPRDDQIKILNSMFDARHKTERKLWSGRNLSTTDIVTNIELFPSHRIAYTEKTFRIKNTKIAGRSTQEEALYTFYLPEGSVVTSASLWVEGIERPSFLTTKGKADSAYTTIVGREQRDPLVLHWQEGNRITVRVFPCTASEDRQFKIGVTSPLFYKNNTLTYQNIDFNGPYWKDAKETINLVPNESLTNQMSNLHFVKKGNLQHFDGSYKSDWYLSFNAPSISTKPFVFNGKSYTTSPLNKRMAKHNFTNIYLDINEAWNITVLNQLWEQTEKKNLFVLYNQVITKVTSENKESLFSEGLKQHFTLFPFHEIVKDHSSLVITTFNQNTPTLDDLQDSDFLADLSNGFKTKDEPFYVFNIGNDLSQYMRTLRDMRAIQINNVEWDEVLGRLKNETVELVVEDNHTIVNSYGDFALTMLDSLPSAKKGGPDHLMRLFVYNDVLRTVGKNYFNKKEMENEWISKAQSAHVVTPISSLIVLETQADYDRFNITQGENSLDNASIGNSGAVPEPHEWLLIFILLITAFIFYYKK